MEDENIATIYVESPVFTEEDKNTYKFINPDIDLSEEVTNRYKMDDERGLTQRLMQPETNKAPEINGK